MLLTLDNVDRGGRVVPSSISGVTAGSGERDPEFEGHITYLHEFEGHITYLQAGGVRGTHYVSPGWS